ncbi:MAG TPA: GTPase Era [Sneathiellales bacterium]|jgi:GTP-binding protein Era|nr:GTPase Era [Sneathiellales bacterium]
MTKQHFGTISTDRSQCGYVALIGAPNAGKSTLLNQVVGTKIAIVTRKVQTTRTRITGILVKGDAQIIFVDTPGIFAPRRRIDRAMVGAAWRGADDADQIVVLVDAERGATGDTDRILTQLRQSGRTAVLALNKIDAVARPKLLDLAAELDRSKVFTDVFMISALTGDGVGDLVNHLSALMPKGPWLYPEDQLSDITERLMAAEITREKLYGRLHQELPYQTAVDTEEWNDQKDGSARISQVIYVQSKSQKPIVLGKGGRTIKEIGSLARADMEQAFGRRVHLFLFVKIKPDWADDRDYYRALGLDYPE